MIKTSRQLKDKIRNMSGGDSDKALALFRTYMMERFLERVSVSDYQLMFEERTIPLMTYNVETLLAEKCETVLTRGTANTRMRDFYDIHMLLSESNFNADVLKTASIL